MTPLFAAHNLRRVARRATHILHNNISRRQIQGLDDLYRDVRQLPTRDCSEQPRGTCSKTTLAPFIRNNHLAGLYVGQKTSPDYRIRGKPRGIGEG